MLSLAMQHPAPARACQPIQSASSSTEPALAAFKRKEHTLHTRRTCLPCLKAFNRRASAGSRAWTSMHSQHRPARAVHMLRKSRCPWYVASALACAAQLIVTCCSSGWLPLKLVLCKLWLLCSCTGWDGVCFRRRGVQHEWT